MMGNETVALTTRVKNYDNLEQQASGSGSSSSTQPPPTPPPASNRPLQIERVISDNVLWPPNATISKAIFNPTAWATQNYNIVEDLAQAPYAMSTLEVLQHYLSQRKTLLSALGVVDPAASNCIMFNLDYFKTRLSHNLAFQIHTTVKEKSIHRTIIYEGASTCVMSLSCWRAIVSPEIN